MRRPSYPEKRGSSVIIILIFNPLKIHILHLLDMERKKRKTTNFSAILCPTPPPPCLVQRPPLFFSCLTHCDKTSNNIWKYFWPIFSSWHCSCTLTTPFCRSLEFWVGKGQEECIFALLRSYVNCLTYNCHGFQSDKGFILMHDFDNYSMQF